MITLRPYQEEALTAVRDGYRRGLRRMVVSWPCGMGKTIAFSTITQGAVAKERRVLILAHRDELLNQARDKMLLTAPELDGRIGLVKGTEDEWELPITVASVQSLHKRRLERIMAALGVDDPWDVVVVDECHRAAAPSYQRILSVIGCLNPETRIMTLGVSATPQRADNKDLGETFQEIVHHVDLLSAIRQGYLVDLKGISLRLDALDLTGVRVSGGDYLAGETGDRLMEADAPRHVCGAWRVHASDRKTIIFTPTIRVAHEMAHEFQRHDIRAVALSGETSLAERRQILEDYTNGDIQVIANSQVLSEGYDEPSVECVVIARPTRSQVLYSQMIGRGTRPYPGKTDCLILDTVGATSRLDLVTLPKLFGLGAEAAETGEQTILELDVARRERQVREGRIVAEQVDLFDRQRLAWLMDEPGRWILGGVKGEGLLLAVQPDSTWTAYRFYETEGYYRREAQYDILGEGLDLGYGQGVVEEYVRRHGVPKLADREASWRKGARASEGQLQYLAQLGVTPDPGMTKGEASDQIEQARVRRLERRALRRSHAV